MWNSNFQSIWDIIGLNNDNFEKVLYMEIFHNEYTDLEQLEKSTHQFRIYFEGNS